MTPSEVTARLACGKHPCTCSLDRQDFACPTRVVTRAWRTPQTPHPSHRLPPRKVPILCPAWSDPHRSILLLCAAAIAQPLLQSSPPARDACRPLPPLSGIVIRDMALQQSSQTRRMAVTESQRACLVCDVEICRYSRKWLIFFQSHLKPASVT